RLSCHWAPGAEEQAGERAPEQAEEHDHADTRDVSGVAVTRFSRVSARSAGATSMASRPLDPHRAFAASSRVLKNGSRPSWSGSRGAGLPAAPSISRIPRHAFP